MKVAIAVTPDGMVGGGWGKARDVALATVENGAIQDWHVEHVEWDRLHDEGGEGQHHARIARFLLDHQVNQVITGHMGPGMEHMLGRMGIQIVTGVTGPAKDVVLQHAR